MKNHIFDLDGTIICSKHRQKLKPNGDLDLDHWIANRAKYHLVMADKLLPLSRLWRAIQLDNRPAICTSRVISHLDEDFLLKHKLIWSTFMHREGGDFTSDAEYKVKHIRNHLDRTGWDASTTTLYDDHAGVRQAVRKELGLKVFDPVPFNTRAASPPRMALVN
jgi:hypothetical protein